MTRTWRVRIVVDAGGTEPEAVAATIRKRLSAWQALMVDIEPDTLVRVTARTDLLSHNAAQEIGVYLAGAVRTACTDAGFGHAAVQLTAVE